MQLIQPRSRIKFTGQDLDFIVTVLGMDANNMEGLTQLLTDEESRDLILDDEKLYRALLETPRNLEVSTQFYFYVVVRRVLKHCGIESREVADYVAEMLSQFARSEHLECRTGKNRGSLDYFFEMLQAIQEADEHTAFLIRTHMGNQSLFMTGVFPDRIRSRARYRGAPDLHYYEELGRSSFDVAGNHRLARNYELTDIFRTLSEQFHTARMALNQVAETIFFLDTSGAPPELLAR